MNSVNGIPEIEVNLNLGKYSKTVYGNDLKANDLDFIISVSVYDMSDDDFNDSVKVSIKTEELYNFIVYEAYE